MASTPAAKPSKPTYSGTAQDQSGVALFMVLGAISLLAVLISEFTYMTQISQHVAYAGLDEVKAHYLAKSGFKISLLRLKAYQKVKSLVGGGKGAAAVIPQSTLDKIWNFPFVYPIPVNLPGLLPTQKDEITKFQKDSNLEGNFSSIIESESAHYNINSVIKQFAPMPSGSPSPSPTVAAGAPPVPPGTPPTSPSATPSFNPQTARDSLSTFLKQEISNKFEADNDFANDYRDFKFDEFMDNLFAWLDHTYQRKQNPPTETLLMKGAPMYDLSELHMVPLMDDQLYNLFYPTLTAALTTGININTMQEDMLRALVPGITDDEVKAFYTFRDSTEVDNTFKDASGFFQYLEANVAIFRKSGGDIQKYESDLKTRGIQLVTDETTFKITVQAQVNQVTQLIQAVVMLTGSGTPNPTPSQNPNGTAAALGGGTPQLPNSNPSAYTPPDSGLKITFMRFL